MAIKIDFDNPGHIKLCLLSQGLRVDDPKIFDVKKFAANQFPYGYSNESVKKFPKIPSELILPEEVVVGIHIRKNSPWSLIFNNRDVIYLTYKNRKISKIWFNPQPFYYGKKIAKTLAEKIAVMYGLYTLSFFTRGWCYYFIKNMQCRFCSLAPTRSGLGKENVTAILPKLAAQVTVLAFKLDKQRILYINHCSGSHKDNDLGVALQIQVLKTLKGVAPDSIRQHMLTMPPNNPSYIKELKRAGLQTLNFAIEVFNPDLFKTICPGKNKYYGYDNFLGIFDKAVDIMGKGNMYANFVAGLESIESMAGGFEYFGKRGIVPSVNIFHPDPRSIYAKKPPPSLNYIFEVAKLQSSIYFQYSFKPIFPRGGTRNSLDAEVFKGYFK